MSFLNILRQLLIHLDRLIVLLLHNLMLLLQLLNLGPQALYLLIVLSFEVLFLVLCGLVLVQHFV